MTQLKKLQASSYSLNLRRNSSDEAMDFPQFLSSRNQPNMLQMQTQRLFSKPKNMLLYKIQERSTDEDLKLDEEINQLAQEQIMQFVISSDEEIQQEFVEFKF